MDDLREAITQAFTEHFADTKLTNLLIEPDFDHDGDPILRIKFVFEQKNDRLDPQKVKSMIRHLREPLNALREDRFPVVSYVSREEFDGEAA